MKRLAPLLLVGLLGGANLSTAQPKVDAQGITSKVRIEEVVSGHLVERNGKFKLRATEVTFAQGGQLTVYRAGDYFYESGNIVHTARNDTKSPLRILFVEILPADWAGPTVIPPRS